MKIGLISDVHGNAAGLNAVLGELSNQDVGQVICAGDIIGYYPMVNEVIELLRNIDAICVKGNHESYLLGQIPISKARWISYSLDYVDSVITPDNRKWLKKLPLSRQMEIDGVSIEVHHGSPWDIEEYVYPDHSAFDRFEKLRAEFIILGNTHWPMIKNAAGVTVVNPGSCGQPRDYDPRAAYGILDTSSREVELYRTPYNVASVCELAAQFGLSPDLITILTRTKS